MVDARDDKAVWNSWYPIGAPPDLRRQHRVRTRLLDRDIDLAIHRTSIAAGCEGRSLPVVERLGYIWTTLGEPDRMPESLVEYYEVDRLTMNIWSTPIRCSGLRIVDNVIDNAHFPFLHPGILGDADHLDLPPHDNFVDGENTLWSVSHRAWLPLIKSVAEYTYRITSPFSVILFIHRPKAPGAGQRFDYLGVFAQPTSEDSFIAHKMFAWVREDWMDLKQLRSDQQWISVQDKYALERHDPRKLPIEGKLEMSVAADSASMAYRAWLKDQDVRYGALRGGS